MVVFYPCCGDYGDYLRGFFSILSYPQVFVSIRETGLFCSGLGSFSKLGYRDVTSHLLMPSGTTNKSCYSENCSVFEGFYALFVQGGGGVSSSASARPHREPKHLQE